MNSRYVSMAVFLLLVVFAAYIAGSFEAGQWYFTMIKPDWTPPAWVFGPVWGVLYLLMALAMWKVWNSGHVARNGALVWWLLQLVFNVAWSWLFFGLERTGWAMLELLLLIGLVIFCVRVFITISKQAALMMMPYLLWLGFAWLLNFSIWRMNGGSFGF